MEIDPFSRNTPESSSDESTDDESSAKKKKKSKRSPLLSPGTAADKNKEAGTTDKTEDKATSVSAEPLWRRILGQSEEEKSVLLEHAESDVPESDETSEASSELGTELDSEADVELLSEDERLAVAQAYIDARQAELMTEQAEALRDGDEQQASEHAADLSLLENMRRFLLHERSRDEPIEAPINHAYEFTVEALDIEPETVVVPTEDLPELAPETLPLPPEVTQRTERQPQPFLQPEATYTSDGPQYDSVPINASDESYQADYDYKRKTGSALLVGGLVGYAIGRRRGRIKTEKRLKTVEKKLTKQVEAVQQQLVQKEQQIRSLARENFAAKTAVEGRPTKIEPALRSEKLSRPPTELLGSVTLKAVEAPRIIRTPEMPMQSSTGPEVAAGTVSRPSNPEKPKPVAALSRSELLVSAGEVTVGATNLRRVFETNLVSEQGLRNLLLVHERGGNVRESLEREIVEKEMSYERDPRLRNSSVVGSLAASKVVRADIDRPTPVSSADDTAHPQTDDAATMSTATRASKQPQAIAVAAVVTLLVVIAVLLVILFTSR